MWLTLNRTWPKWIEVEVIWTTTKGSDIWSLKIKMIQMWRQGHALKNWNGHGLKFRLYLPISRSFVSIVDSVTSLNKINERVQKIKNIEDFIILLLFVRNWMEKDFSIFDFKKLNLWSIRELGFNWPQKILKFCILYKFKSISRCIFWKILSV